MKVFLFFFLLFFLISMFLTEIWRFNPFSVNDVSRLPKFSAQNSALTGYARRIFQIGDISQSEFHQPHAQKQKNILVFSLINACTLLLLKLNSQNWHICWKIIGKARG